MLKNYLIIAWRNLWNHKFFSFIIVLGLTIGIATGILIVRYVGFELSYDQFNKNKDRIYRVAHHKSVDGKLLYSKAQVYLSLGPDVTSNFPQIEAYTSLFKMSEELEMSVKISREDGQMLKFKEKEIYTASSDFFKVFSFDLLQGDPNTVLDAPNKVVLSRSIAQKYFGDENPINKTVDAGIWGERVVSGVFEDVSRNSHLQFDILFAWDRFTDHDATNWHWDGFFTYLLLTRNTQVADFEKELNRFSQEKLKPLTERSGITSEFFLQPLSAIHLHSNLSGEASTNGNIIMVRWLMALAVAIMAIAWINYINLTTIRLIRRAKEVGIRKVVGATKVQLFSQFLVEAFILNGSAVLGAFILAYFIGPVIEVFFGFNLLSNLLAQPVVLTGMSIVIVIGTLVSGIYPAIFQAALKPINGIKGNMSKTSSPSLKRGLVVFQFGVSILLIICLFALNRQLSFMKNHELGINIDQVLVVTNFKSHEIHDPASAAFVSQLQQYPQIDGASISSSVPGFRSWLIPSGIRRVGFESEENAPINIIRTDRTYMEIYQQEFLAGRNFHIEPRKDSSAVVLSESAIKTLGFSSSFEAIGEKIHAFHRELMVIGVIKDYHSRSLRESYEPLIFVRSPGPLSFFSIRLTTGNINHTLGLIKKAYEIQYPDNPFDYFFLDQFFDDQYRQDEKLSQLIGAFAGLAIFIAGIGLFALSVYMITDRTKEIGIRKVLGASGISIVQLISKNFMGLVILSSCIAVPIAYWLIKKRLEDYSFGMEINGWLFVLPVTFVLGIAFITISFQVIRVALANPVKSLRYE